MTYTTRVCEWCGADYVPHRRTQRTCCKDCRVHLNSHEGNLKNRKPHAEKNCLICGRKFTQPRCDSKFCSAKCKNRWGYLHMKGFCDASGEWHQGPYVPLKYRRPSKVCKSCKKEFRSQRSDAIYCSPACQRKANHAHLAELKLASSRRWAQEHPEQIRLSSRNYKAKRRSWEQSGLAFTLRDWRRLKARYEYQCAYCGKPCKRLQLDHVIPLSRGGEHHIGNILPACPHCNMSKNDKLLIEWRHWRLEVSAA